MTFATAALANPANQAMVSALVDEPYLVLSASYANTLGVVSEIPAIVLPPADTVHLQTSLTVAAGSSPVTLWTQTIRQVPGPLPVLGAGAWRPACPAPSALKLMSRKQVR